MDEKLVQYRTTQVLVPFLKLLREEEGRCKDALLVLDSYRGQTMKLFKLTRAVIPTSCTSLMQLLDVSVNRSFKVGMRHRYSTWFGDEGIGYTTLVELAPTHRDPTRNLKKPLAEKVLRWIVSPGPTADAPFDISTAVDGNGEDALAMEAEEEGKTEEDSMEDEDYEEDNEESEESSGNERESEEEDDGEAEEVGGGQGWDDDEDSWKGGRYVGEEVVEWVAGHGDN
ncbi:unnamed protein product [Closterium sp. Yama58-4]|nr:unnamed protein product [Closterium sp. Yama58-4]